ncbi:hypothetical protein, partial [Xanthomonas arboricola]|uniref:hypothetical protein n=1 Tax=Xanthomonas arboricola TaxID=56448 RepID=UPI0019D6CCBB
RRGNALIRRSGLGRDGVLPVRLHRGRGRSYEERVGMDEMPGTKKERGVRALFYCLPLRVDCQ